MFLFFFCMCPPQQPDTWGRHMLQTAQLSDQFGFIKRLPPACVFVQSTKNKNRICLKTKVKPWCKFIWVHLSLSYLCDLVILKEKFNILGCKVHMQTGWLPAFVSSHNRERNGILVQYFLGGDSFTGTFQMNWMKRQTSTSAEAVKDSKNQPVIPHNIIIHE